MEPCVTDHEHTGRNNSRYDVIMATTSTGVSELFKGGKAKKTQKALKPTKIKKIKTEKRR